MELVQAVEPPMELFDEWFEAASHSEPSDPNATQCRSPRQRPMARRLSESC